LLARRALVSLVRDGRILTYIPTMYLCYPSCFSFLAFHDILLNLHIWQIIGRVALWLYVSREGASRDIFKHCSSEKFRATKISNLGVHEINRGQRWFTASRRLYG